MNECTLRTTDCYNADSTNCWYCKHAKEPAKDELENNYVSNVDRVIELYDYLSEGKVPEGVHVWRPKMSRKHAFSVIWFLQEIIHCLPDSIERCDNCDYLFDTNNSGYYLDDQYELKGKPLPKKYWGHWCDNCVPNVDFELA